jgi:hypothetical protein
MALVERNCLRVRGIRARRTITVKAMIARPKYSPIPWEKITRRLNMGVTIGSKKSNDFYLKRCSRDGVNPSFAPGMATTKSLQRQPAPLHKTIFLNGFIAILRAGRYIAARRRPKW